MDDESKKLLEDTLELTKENNEMLRHMRRSQKFSFILRAIYWFVIIGIALGSFYFLQPYIDGLQNAYGDSKSTLEQFKNAINLK